MNASVRFVDKKKEYSCSLYFSLECGYNHANSTSLGMLSTASAMLFVTTKLPTARSFFAISNTNSRLINSKKKLNKNKSKNGD